MVSNVFRWVIITISSSQLLPLLYDLAVDTYSFSACGYPSGCYPAVAVVALIVTIATSVTRQEH